MTDDAKGSGNTTPRTVHTSVLLQETIDSLALKASDTVVDATLGGGGHGREILLRLEKDGTYIALDQDHDALLRTEATLPKGPATIHVVNANFRNLAQVLDELSIPIIDKALFDLGLSSDQLDQSGRGFSFLRDEPLRMTMSTEESLVTAEIVVNEWEEEHLADVLYGFGDERFSRRIAKSIVEARAQGPIKTTGQLAEIIAGAIPKRFQRRGNHPATKSFQAIRIAVNDELGALSEGLKAAWEHLNEGGRIAVISFHSLEDRIVKRFFHEQVAQGMARLLMKKPIVPTPAEILHNPRARSAKLRTIEKLPTSQE